MSVSVADTTCVAVGVAPSCSVGSGGGVPVGSGVGVGICVGKRWTVAAARRSSSHRSNASVRAA